MSSIYRVRAPSKGWVGGPGLNTFYFQDVNPDAIPTAPSALLCVNRVRDAFLAGVGLYPSEWSMNVDPQCDALNTQTGDLVDSFVVAAPAQINGGQIPGFQVIAAMLCLSLRTGTIVENRRLRGRAFLGPLAKRGEGDGSPLAQEISFAQTVGTALLDKGISGPDLVVWHRPRAASIPPAPPRAASAGASGVVTTTTVKDQFAILRSRRD